MAAAAETGRFAADQATRLLDRLALRVSAARHSPDEKAVHDLRVAIRRLTQSLVVLKPCFVSKEVKKIRRSLNGLMTLAGDVRDHDIALECLSKMDGPDISALDDEFSRRRHAAEKTLIAALNDWVNRKFSAKWRDRLQSGREAGGFTRRATDVTARRELPRVAARFFRCGDRAAGTSTSAAELHQFRIAAKKLRYTIELFAASYGPAADRWLEQVAAIQSSLGRVNDCRTVRSLLQEIGGNKSLDAVLKKRQRRKTVEFQRLWAAEFGQATAVKNWMRALRRSPRKPAGRSDTVTNRVAIAG